MNQVIKEQIINILKKTNCDINKFKFIKISNNIFKLSYETVFISYIEVNNKKNSSQTMNWKLYYKHNLQDYIKKISKFQFDVVAIVDILNTTDKSNKILNKCISGLKNQTNYPFIVLIVSTHEEKQYAINNNIDFYWTIDKININRYLNTLKYVRGNFTFVQNIMFVESNNIFFDNWIHSGVTLIKKNNIDIVGSDYCYLVDIDNQTMYKKNLNNNIINNHFKNHSDKICWYNGLIMNKKILNKVNWNPFSTLFKNNFTFSIFDKMLKNNITLKKIKNSELVSIFSASSHININEFILDNSISLESISELPLLNQYPISDLNIKIKPINSKILPSTSKDQHNIIDKIIPIKNKTKIIDKKEVKSIHNKLIVSKNSNTSKRIINDITIYNKKPALKDSKAPIIYLEENKKESKKQNINILINKLKENKKKNKKIVSKKIKRINIVKKQIIILVIANNNENNLDKCIKYLKKQTMKPEIFLIVKSKNQINYADKKRLNYYYDPSDNKYMRINSSIKKVKTLNPSYVMLLEDNCLLSSDWVKTCFDIMNNPSDLKDIVGMDYCYIYNYDNKNKYKISLIPKNLNFINKHYRNIWSLINGRIMSNKFLYKINWSIFTNNFDTDIEIALGTKIITYCPSMTKITDNYSLILTNNSFIEDYSSKSYYDIIKDNNNFDKKIYDIFNDVLGDYIDPVKHKIPNIKRKINNISNNINNLTHYPKIYNDYGNNMVDISIVLPTYNGYPHIKNIINNILDQTFNNYELIIVNDGSTQPELDKYLNSISSKNIKIIKLLENGGLPHALNVGIINSFGKYWTWLSDDNIIHPDFLYKLKIQLDRGVGFAYSNYIFIDDMVKDSSSVNIKIKYNNVEDILYNWRGMPSFMWRKELVDQIGFFDEKIQGCEDYDFNIRTFIACGDSNIHVDNNLFTYYKRNGSLTDKLHNKIPILKNNVVKKYTPWSKKLSDLHNLFYNSNNKLKENIIYLSDIDYYKLYQRPQQIMKQLSKSHNCYFIAKNKNKISKDGRVYIIDIDIFNIYIENFNIHNINPIIYYNDPKFSKYKQLINPQCTLFDLIDNPEDEFVHWKNGLVQSINESDIVIYSCKYLENVIKKYNKKKKCHYISNGCDYQHFYPARNRLGNKPNELKHINKPIIGYYGAITTWLDFELIEKIANINEIHVVMIGGIPEYNTYNMTFEHYNITWINHQDYKFLPSYLSWFDICMIPFKDTEMVKGVNPIKFHEYCCSGKPIISTNFPDIDISYYKINHNNYNNIILDIIHKNEFNKVNQNYINFGLKHSWSSKAEQILDTINIDYTIIYPPLIEFDHLMQRPTQIIRASGKINKVRSIFIDVKYDAKEIKNYKLLILNKSTFNRNIKKFIKGKLIFYYTYPNDIKYKKFLNPDYVIYDLIDNPTDEFKSWNNQNLLLSIKEADLFTCSAKIMLDNYGKYNSNNLLISNGCDINHFSTNKNITPHNFPNIKNKTIIGYYGALSTWFDEELVKKIASYNPQKYVVVIIGKSDNPDYSRTFKHPNIFWLDHVKYDILPNYLHKFDICMIPFKLTEMIKGCDPLKFYEFLAAGKPIMTTRMLPIIKYKDDCYFIDKNNVESIMDKIYNNLKKGEDKNTINSRMQIAKINNWESKANLMITSLIKYDITTTIIYPQYISWHTMFQRPQQMITSLSKKKGVRCIFIDHTIQTLVVKNNSLIISPNYKNALRFIQGKIVIYYNNPSSHKLLSNYKYDVSIFELVDNPVGEFANWMNDLKPAMNISNRISLTSKEMIKYVPKNKKFSIIPNGSDFHHFSRACNKLDKPSDFPSKNIIKGRPIIGYFGAHAEWMNWELVKSIADISSIHLVMIGRMEGSIYDHSIEHDNITFIPRRDYQILPNYLSHFDICMIPFRLTEMIKGCDPIKFYEYISAGKPVVATRMEELEKFSDICYFIDNKNYKDIINKAISEKDNNILIKKRRKIALNNGWDSRADSLLELL